MIKCKIIPVMFWLCVSLLVSSCSSITGRIINVTKPVWLGSGNKCSGADKAEDFDHEVQDSSSYAIGESGGKSGSSSSGKTYLDSSILKEDPRDEKVTVIDKIYFGSYGSQLLLGGTDKAWVGIEGRHCARYKRSTRR